MDWHPTARREPGNSAGSFLPGHPRKGLLHSTEGRSAAGAIATYRRNNSWPHFTEAPEGLWQHLPISVAARSLRNLSGGHETNRDGVIQIELVGTADRRLASSWGDLYVGGFPRNRLDSIAALMRWIEENGGVERTSSVRFIAYPESYGANNGVRLNAGQWHAYSGWLGHSHAVENLHGDPGAIDIDYLLQLSSRPVPTPITDEEDDEMPNFIPYLATDIDPLDSNGNGSYPLPEGVRNDQITAVSFGDPEDNYERWGWKRSRDSGRFKVWGPPGKKTNLWVRYDSGPPS
jgi:hypothetical protein